MNTAYNVILKNLRMLKYVMLKYTATSDIQTRIKVARVDKPADDGQHFFSFIRGAQRLPPFVIFYNI